MQTRKPQAKRGVFRRILRDLFRYYPVMLPLTIVLILFSAVSAAIPAVFSAMLILGVDKNAQRMKRHTRVRGKISGTPERPRLNVYRSNANIYAQVIDDVNGNTLVSASSVEKDFEGNGGNVEAAKKIGSKIAERALAKGIEEVVFDRGGYIYHGRVKALAEAAREGGLKF